MYTIKSKLNQACFHIDEARQLIQSTEATQMEENTKAMIQGRLNRIQKKMDSFDTYQHAHYWDFDAYLDRNYKAITVAGMRFQPSEVVRRCSSIEYESMFKEWATGQPKGWFPEYEELYYEAEELKQILTDGDIL